MTDLVNTWITRLCESHALGAGKLDEFGQWQLVFEQDHRCAVYLPADSPHLFFTAEICPIPDNAREAFYAALLSHNLSLLDTGGASFAIDPVDGMVWLNFGQPLISLDAASFENSLGTFLELAIRWHSRFSETVPGTEPFLGRPVENDPLFAGMRI
ncbi:type III secretion system chaperone [Verrucomicrobium sp. BvORR106]|uniref:type III secretion system chaperone n=1 Tax=Verrucomicrobium sp. BvORR106 TaxID=1403819 RepID=UPI00056F75A3|nr:type III secretion system chaperone [Verrucomicrobium sp. BvORR106]